MSYVGLGTDRTSLQWRARQTAWQVGNTGTCTQPRCACGLPPSPQALRAVWYPQHDESPRRLTMFCQSLGDLSMLLHDSASSYLAFAAALGLKPRLAAAPITSQ